MNRRTTGRIRPRSTRQADDRGELFRSPQEAVIVDSLGSALLSSFLRELRNAYFEGGLDGVDTTIDGINGYLSQLGAQYWVGPGAVLEQDENGNDAALGVPFCQPDSGYVLTTMWVMLSEPRTDENPPPHSCPKCSGP